MRKIFLMVVLVMLVFSGCQKADNPVGQESPKQEAETTQVESGDKDQAVQEEVNLVPETIGDWKLAWHDEFDQEIINMDYWSFDVPTNGRWNGEVQSYTDKNAFIKDGSLIIEARKEDIKEPSGETYAYSSGKMISKGKEKFTYGRVEIRAKMPEGQGIWPALWMMPEDEPYYGTWPVCGEIDIMEMLGHKPSEIHGTIHFGEPHKQLQGSYALEEGVSFADDYHVYAIEWQPGKIDWYLDGQLYHTANDWFSKASGASEDYAYPAPFNQDFFIIMNISVGGTWPGNPDETTVFPQQMAIDYVRVYEKEVYEVFDKPEPVVIEARPPMADGNYIYNGDFAISDFEVETSEGQSQVMDEWTFFQGPGGLSSFIVKEGVMHVQIDKGGETDYAVQFFQTPVNLKQDVTYEASFDIMADADRSIKIKIGSDGDRGWVDYANEAPMKVTSQWETKTFRFTMTQETDPKGRFEFNMGLEDADLYIKNVRLVEVE